MNMERMDMELKQNEVITFKVYQLFEVDNKKYIFTQDNAIYEIDDRTQTVIESSGMSYGDIYERVKIDFTEQEFAELINEMMQSDFIVRGNTEMEEIQNDSLREITLMLVQSCNMSCKYCYAEEGVYNDEGKMDIATAKKGFEFLVNNSSANELGVILFGGEPLMAFDLIKELVVYIREREKEIGKKVYINMTTNGTLLNEEIETFFETYNVRMMISIDGDKQVHDCNRYFKNKVGSYELVIDKTKRLREQGKLTARATISSGKQDLVYTFEHLQNLGFRSIVMSPAINLFDKSDFIEFTKRQEEYVEEFFKAANCGDYSTCKKMRMVYSRLQRIHNYTGRERAYSCGAARAGLAIDIHGDMYPCHRFVSLKNYVLGNINKSLAKQKDFLKQINVNEGHEKCKACWLKNMCMGDCPYNNYEFTGNVSATDERVCEINIATFKKMIEVYLKLQEGQKKELFDS